MEAFQESLEVVENNNNSKQNNAAGY